MINIFDGAMGTMLQQAGLPAGDCPERWNLNQPTAVTAIHRQYVESGADIIETNTFGANRVKLKHYGLDNQVAKINVEAVKAARAACGPRTRIAGSVGPTGKFIAPLGELSFNDAYDVYYEQISALGNAGVDLIIIETIIDIQEMRVALLAAKAATDKPVICQLSFGADGRTLTGTDPSTAAVILEALGADVIGANCSLGPAQLLPIITTLATVCALPISVQPNAGMPELIQGQTLFPMGPEELAAWAPKLIAAGATYLGGCCGTTPNHIKAMRQAVDGIQASPRATPPSRTALTSRSKTIYLGQGLAPVIIGERINPTALSAMADDIHAGNFSGVKRDAKAQIKAGATVLNVNMSILGSNETVILQQAVEQLALMVNVPLAIDTTDPASLEAGLKAFSGRALINSATADPKILETFLPLAKKYGAAVICQPIAPGVVPNKATDRLALAKSIVDAAFSAGLRPQDLLLDALVMTVTADAMAAQETLSTLRLYRQHFGFPTVMGLSDVSYGLPHKEVMNAAFCAMALAAGLDAPILNPLDPLMRDILPACAALLGYDACGEKYNSLFAATPPQPAQ